MTLFKMPLISLLLAVLGPGTTWACEAVLKSSSLQMTPAHLVLPPRQPPVMRKMIEQSLLFPIHTEHGFWSIAFDLRADHKNEGFLIEGHRRGEDYIAHSVSHARREDEKDYFKAVAEMHGMKDQTVTLKSKDVECGSILVQGWIEAKLWLKHHLKISEVRNILQSGKTAKIYEHGFQDPRYRIQGFDTSGRSVAIVIAEKNECPHILVTAFAEADEPTIH